LIRSTTHTAPHLPLWLLFAWFLFFLLNPFYLFESGLPQPSDWLMVVIFAYIFFTGLKPQGTMEVELVNRHRWFVIYVTIVNSLWFFFIDQSQEKRFPTFLHSFFYIFNFLTLRSSLILSRAYKNKFLIYTSYAIGLGMMIQVGLSFLMGSTESRNPLFFNNPNQLGYYALLSGSLLVYAVRTVKINMLFQLISYFSFFYLTLLSSSKGALAGSVVLIALAVLNQGLLNFKQLIILSFAVGLGSYFIFQDELGSRLFDYSYQRFEMIGESRDDSYEGRGYDRIVNNPEYMVLGAGEGGYYRFDTLLEAGEIHSSFGTIIFCYGVIGLFLFFRFLAYIFKGSSFFELLYFIPIFAYSITHQGLRDSLFWVFLGVVFILNEQKIIAKFQKLKLRKIALMKRNRTPVPSLSSLRNPGPSSN
jgi:hypothetical protein